MEKEKTSKVSIASIIILILFIALVVLAGGRKTPSVSVEESTPTNPAAGIATPKLATDHTRGNGPIVIIEYSDTDCPFCRTFHSTMKQVVAQYGDRVTWVYRHFPLDALHAQARTEAEAAECVARIGGEEKFWEYLDLVFEITPSSNPDDINRITTLAHSTGIDTAAFDTCLSNRETRSIVETHVQYARLQGAQGTPFTIILTPDGKEIPLMGSRSFAELSALIESL